jgi:hypothetical protein
MKAHVGRVLAALTVDELREVRDRLDVLARDAGHPEAIASVADAIAPGGEVIVSGQEQRVEETVDDRSGWILERRGEHGAPPEPPAPVLRERVGDG